MNDNTDMMPAAPSSADVIDPRPITELTEEYTQLLAVISSLTEIKKEMSEQILARSRELGVGQWTTADRGKVTVVADKAPSVIVDQEALAATLAPDETMTVPKPWALDAAKRRLVVDGGKAVDAVTGEIVDWATVGPMPEPYLAWSSSAKQKQAKADTDWRVRAALVQVLNPEPALALATRSHVQVDDVESGSGLPPGASLFSGYEGLGTEPVGPSAGEPPLCRNASLAGTRAESTRADEAMNSLFAPSESR